MFKGIFTAIVTPFKNGEIDLVSFEKLVKEQKEAKVNGIVISGTTGESPNLSQKEKRMLVDVAMKYKNENFKIILGTGSNNTYHAIEETLFAQSLNVDAALIVTPYYNKPSQQGLYEHFKAIHDKTNIPVILYNVPSRTSSSLKLETITKLSKLERIIGIKEATGDLVFATEIRHELPDFTLLSGDDGTFLPFLSIGGEGCISVVSNVAPKMVVKLYNLYFEKNHEEAIKLNKVMLDLTKAMFVETNPIPVKTALFELGKITEEFRLPLTPIADSNRLFVKNLLEKNKLYL